MFWNRPYSHSSVRSTEICDGNRSFGTLHFEGHNYCFSTSFEKVITGVPQPGWWSHVWENITDQINLLIIVYERQNTSRKRRLEGHVEFADDVLSTTAVVSFHSADKPWNLFYPQATFLSLFCMNNLNIFSPTPSKICDDLRYCTLNSYRPSLARHSMCVMRRIKYVIFCNS